MLQLIPSGLDTGRLSCHNTHTQHPALSRCAFLTDHALTVVDGGRYFQMENAADLDNLLLWLGPDTEVGARRYVEVRQRLIALFQCRGCVDSGELADQTLDRTARAILKPGFTFEGNPIAYLRGVARNVYLESLRKNRTVSQDVLPELADTAGQPMLSNSGTERLYDCLDHCLSQLTDEKRAILLRYYHGEKSGKIDGRLQLAQEKGIELNALRIQVFRLRNVVRQCVELCADPGEIARLV
jgi:DNA-directed RNA polymerase specialized sigma24 family protein